MSLCESPSSLPFPPSVFHSFAGHQQPEDIHNLLEGAKGATAAGQAMTNVMAAPSDEAYDASIENAIREDLLQHGNSSGNVQLQQFIYQHSGAAMSMQM